MVFMNWHNLHMSPMIRHNNHIDFIAHIERLDFLEVHMQYKLFEDIQQQINDKLTPMAQKLLSILQEQEDWINRSNLASMLHKSVLNKWDVVLLSRLAEGNFIEVRKVSHHGPIGYEWQYRAIPQNPKSENMI